MKRRGRPRKYFTKEEKLAAARKHGKRWRERNPEKVKLLAKESYKRKLLSNPDYFRTMYRARYIKNQEKAKLYELNKYYSAFSLEELEKVKLKAESRLSLVYKLIAQKELERTT